ncbi:carboxylate-amine ligase [Micromonospora lutea]|uniref:Putative glutamate--cysteine ligase 2 n=1 Tax=Micromonospora lutea TaxID=419825 RepID=A0ABQ4IYD3_9ACTN|nr:glutamate--cysteine ligase [Micromonospora lutea]GIJ22920.1 putative glutamate--cysteine ligase 2-3 [Micromonospora lutea]
MPHQRIHGSLDTSGTRIGVEEEFFLVDGESRAVVPAAASVVERAREQLGDRVCGEISTVHLETRTRPVTSVPVLLGELTEARRVVARCAVDEGLRLVASGTPVIQADGPAPIVEGPRPARGTAMFRGLHDDLAICALHVHVEMPDREHAVQVSNHLRAHLPLLIALSANSPYWRGRDTGYASWRTVIWSRWPVAGPPPRFTSAAHYEQTVAAVGAAGATVDSGTLFWDVRLSATHPTLEIRVADVPVTAEESALYAALVRALVVRALAAVEHGEADHDVPAELLRLAYWRAARDGLDGELLDLSTGQLVPAAAMVTKLVASLRPVLEQLGDGELLAGWLRRLLALGSGAHRQRTAGRRGDRPADVVDYLIANTVSGTASRAPAEESFLP